MGDAFNGHIDALVVPIDSEEVGSARSRIADTIQATQLVEVPSDVLPPVPVTNENDVVIHSTG